MRIESSTMKIIAICFVAALSILGSNGSPIYKDDVGYTRYAMIPNAEGQMYLIDLEAPQEPESFFVPANDIRFMLYTRSNPTVGERILFRDLGSVQNSRYNAAHPTRLI